MRMSDWSSDVCSSDLVADVVLHVDLDLHDVLVAGQDRHVVAEGLDLGSGDLGHALDRPRQLEVRAGLEDPRELAEAQHHTAFLSSEARRVGKESVRTSR